MLHFESKVLAPNFFCTQRCMVKPSKNIERIAKDNGWNKVVWNAPSDFNWATNTKIKEALKILGGKK